MELLFIAVIAVIAILGVFAVTVGVDSRGFSDDPHRSPYPVGLD